MKWLVGIIALVTMAWILCRDSGNPHFPPPRTWDSETGEWVTKKVGVDSHGQLW